MYEASNNTNTLPDTELVYLKNTYEYEADATVLKFDKDEKNSPFLLLDRTIFYPQGGGQPADFGQITVKDSVTFDILFVAFNNGKVHHYYKDEALSQESLFNDLIGHHAHLKVDSSRRLNNAKSHTSGHLLASVVEKLAPEIVATKGYHFPEGPYIEFKGKLASLTSDDLIKQAHDILKENIDSSTKVIVIDDLNELKDNETLKNKHSYELQAGKKLRLVQIEGFNMVPCGGTHLKCMGELKEVTIRKVQFPKGNTKISYSYA